MAWAKEPGIRGLAVTRGAGIRESGHGDQAERRDEITCGG
jgi:hypothetical protein